jgi:hypothetical protein
LKTASIDAISDAEAKGAVLCAQQSLSMMNWSPRLRNIPG